MDALEMSKSIKETRKMAAQFDSSEILPNHACYTNLMRNYDGRESIAKGMQARNPNFSKSASIVAAATGTTDKAMIPLYVDPSIIDMTRRLTPWVEVMPRVTNYGRTAEFNRLTARGIQGFRIEGAPMVESDDTYVRSSVALKFMYQTGKVTGPYLAASKQYLSNQYVDALNLEVMNKTLSARFCEEDTIINGNDSASRTGYGGVATISGAEYDGMLNTASIQTTDMSSTVIDIDSLRAGVRKARTANDSTTLGQGNPDVMGTDFKTNDDIKGLLQDYQRVANPIEVLSWGYKAVIFEGIPIIPSKFFPTTTNGRAIMIADSQTWQMRVLQDLTYEELAKTEDSYKFMVKLYEALICTAPEFNCKIYDLV